jgi:hypothetical protein
MELRDFSDNKHKIDSRAWYGVQDRLFEMFMARVADNRVRLRQMVAADGGPELDGSLGSLTGLGEWFCGWARRDPDDGESWESVRVNHKVSREVNVLGLRGGSPQLERMEDRVAVYLGDVVMGLVPHSRWVCWRGDAVGDRFAGDIVVDVGDPDQPFNAPLFAGWVCGAAYITSYDESNFHFKPENPREMTEAVEWILGRLEERRVAGKEPVFQPAPTGREAAGGKRPHSGRREYEILKRDGVS